MNGLEEEMGDAIPEGERKELKRAATSNGRVERIPSWTVQRGYRVWKLRLGRGMLASRNVVKVQESRRGQRCDIQM